MELLKEKVALFLGVSLSLFDTQVTTQASLTDEMKTFYSDYMIDNAKPNLVHDQFAQKRPIPKNGGKTIEFRKYSPLSKALTPLTEGVTPSGSSLNVSTLTATIKQYGDFISVSDILQLTAIDNNLTEASKLLGNQAGETLDTVSREVMNAGTNVQYAFGQVSSRHQLIGGDSTPANNHYMSVDAVRLAARNLKTKKGKKINGDFVAIIHPDITFDLTGDAKWEKVKDYDPKDMYEGEIGRIHGCRFVETTEAKIFAADDLTAGSRELTFASAAGQVITVDETLTAGDQTEIIGRKVILKGYLYTVTAAGANSITVDIALQGSPADNDIIYPGEAGAEGRAVYSTLFIAAEAYGTTEVKGGGLEFIVKQLGSAGTADPLNQRATTGWKATKVTERLVEEYMLRVETASTFDELAN